MGKLEQMFLAENGKYILSDKEENDFKKLYEEFRTSKDKYLFFDDTAEKRIACVTEQEMQKHFKNGNYADSDNLIENYRDLCIYSSMHVLRMFKGMELNNIIEIFKEKGLDL